MRKSKFIFAFILIITSAILYLIHYSIFHDFHHIAVFFVEDMAFIPIEVIVVSFIIHSIIEKNEKKRMRSKVNIIVGVFFTNFGTELLNIIAKHDIDIENIKKELIVNNSWTNKEFKALIEKMKKHEHSIKLDDVGIEVIKYTLKNQKQFLLKLLASPVLLEHDTFTDLLITVFHLEEELSSRGEIQKLNIKDKEHLVTDIQRVYKLLSYEWIIYMQHLKVEYPFLFSFAMRTNPFDEAVDIEIK